MKILKELDELTAAEVISPEVAERIRHYAEQRTQSNSSHRLLTVFGGDSYCFGSYCPFGT